MSGGSNVLAKENFDLLRIEISRLLSETEFVLEEREQLINEDDSIEEKLKQLITLIAQKLKLLDTALSEQKKNPEKYQDLVIKESLKTVIAERLIMLKTKREGRYINEKKYNDNRENLEKLEESLGGGKIISSEKEEEETQVPRKAIETVESTKKVETVEEGSRMKKEDNRESEASKEESKLDSNKNPEKKQRQNALVRVMVCLVILLIAGVVIYHAVRNQSLGKDNEPEDKAF